MNCLLEDLIEALVFVAVNHEEDVVELVLDEVRAHQHRLVLGEVLPVLLLPEELDPHFMSAGTLIAHATRIAVAMQMRDITELFPFVENFQTLNE